MNAKFARAIQEAAPDARILNHPLRALERFPLLLALNRAGINDFTATRIECGDARPPKFPVFIRAEDGYGGPETNLLHSQGEFEAAVDDLADRNLPLRGRIAIGFANEQTPEGYFLKYGAFNIGGRIIPHDISYSRTWVVKIHVEETTWASARDEAQGAREAAVERNLRFVKENPHCDVLARAFALARIEYGRADFSIVNGRVQIYEINTNPHLPLRANADTRAERRSIVRSKIIGALKAIDTPISGRGRVAFSVARPRAHNIHLPRRRLPLSLLRRAIDWFVAPEKPLKNGTL